MDAINLPMDGPFIEPINQINNQPAYSLVNKQPNEVINQPLNETIILTINLPTSAPVIEPRDLIDKTIK